MNYDLIIVGGGLGGSTLGGTLAQKGFKVLILEREVKFKDRVRGENMMPWGVAAAQRLGILKILEEAGGHPTRWWNTYVGGKLVSERDVPETTPHKPLTVFNMYHPDMQEALLQHAIRCGAEVRRGASVTGVTNEPHQLPTVVFVEKDRSSQETARLVVGADGRNSQVRSWCGFQRNQDPDILTIAGTLLEGCGVPEEATHLAIGPGFLILMAPQGQGRVRTYCVYPTASGARQLSGEKKIPEFLQLCRDTSVPADWFANAKSAGPLAEFPGADHWVDTVFMDNVVLIGDAAASTDPSWGSGLSLTLLDVEHLLKHLTSTNNWTEALANYTKEHDAYYSTLRRILSWMTDLMWTPGPEAEARREKVLPRLFSEPTGFPDHMGQGPFGPSDESARRLILGLS